MREITFLGARPPSCVIFVTSFVYSLPFVYSNLRKNLLQRIGPPPPLSPSVYRPA